MDAIRLQNVHSIHEMDFVPLRPLTVVVGRNSAGKSSLLRWLPLLAQSIGAPGSAPILWTRRDRGLVDYGSFHETLRRGASPPQIHFAWQGRLEDKNVSFQAESVLESHERATYVAGLNVRVGEVSIRLRCDPSGQVSSITINDIAAEALAPGWSWTVTPSDIIPKIEARGAEGDKGTPGFKQRVDGLLEFKRRRMDQWRLRALAEWCSGWTAAQLKQQLSVYESGTHTWKSDLARLPDDDPRLATLLPRYAVREFPRVISSISRSLQDMLASLVYVAPFRAEPRRAERSPEPSSNLDSRGDALLSFVEGLRPEEQQHLSGWLHDALGFRLILKKEGLYSELRVDQGYGGDDNLADVGFGIGQILPVAVHLWRAGLPGPGSEARRAPMVIMEQPELHLHPAHQGAVGRMLVRHAARVSQRSGRLVVETHSEALINAIGDEIAAKNIASSDVNVLVFERDRGGSPVSVRSVQFDEKGYLGDNWPFDFFSAR